MNIFFIDTIDILFVNDQVIRKPLILTHFENLSYPIFSTNHLDYIIFSKISNSFDLKMLPLTLLRTAQNHPMLVELKNGETYNGHLVSCDNWMNINLREVICTSRDGDRFWRMPEVYLRGVNIKYLRIPDEVIDMVREEESKHQRQSRGKIDTNKRPMLNRNSGGGPGGRGGSLGGSGRNTRNPKSNQNTYKNRNK